MEILYIWFNDYGPFQKQGFQLDAQLRFEFDANDGFLSVSRNPEYIPGFFRYKDTTAEDSAVISNITAIVGENGAGKTRFLDYIKYVLVRAQNRDIYQALVVIRDARNDVIILYDDSVIPRLQVKDPNGYLSNPQQYRKAESSLKLPESSVIFYSGIFDHTYEEQLNNYYNLSTNYLVRKDKVRRMEEGMDMEKQHLLDVHRDEDLNRQVILVHEFPNTFDEPLPVRIPEQLIVRIREFDANDDKSLGGFAYFYSQIHEYVDNKLIEIVQSIQQQPSNDHRILAKRELFKYRAHRALFRSFLKELSIYMNEHLLKENDSLMDLTSVVSGKKSFLSYTKKFFQAMYNRSVTPEDRTWIDHLNGMVDVFTEFSHAVDPKDWTDSTFTIPVRAQSVKSSESHRFIKLYRGSYQAFPYLDFDWPLSSGEKAFLNLLSRLYTRADGQPFGSNVYLTPKVILLIDEGELYFHPEWQRVFINRLIRFLSAIYGPNRRVQIIITSHSPFLLSDLPASSVNYLKRDGAKTTVSDGLYGDEMKSTFAANIHDLYKRGFFMKSTFGEFAQDKINGVIRDLKKLEDEQYEQLVKEKQVQPLQKAELESLLDVIRLIGEPVLSGKLLEMYNNLLPERRQEERTRQQYEFWKQEMKRLGIPEERND